MRKQPEFPERRKYIRLDSVFPVEFRLVSMDKNEPLTPWIQGFTNNVSKGGICLFVNKLDPALSTLIRNKQAKISMNIQMPLKGKPCLASAKVAWVQASGDQPGGHLIGLSYEIINHRENKMIMRYARFKQMFLPAALSLIILLGLGFSLGTYLNIKLIKGNKALVEQLVRIVQDSSIAKQKVKEINREREDLQLKIQALEARIHTVEQEKAAMGAKVNRQELAAGSRISQLNSLVNGLKQEKEVLDGKLIAVQRLESSVTEELLRLDKKKANLEKANLDKMYKWLLIHQNPRTGLVMSYEGDTQMKGWAFLYDQSLVLQAYLNFADYARAKKIMDFFAKKAETSEGLLYNGYDVSDGSPLEYTTHAGPNIWWGIAIMHYTHKTKDNSYLPQAESIARAIIALEDPDGGIRGGPKITWYSTEHNLDAYAFFNMLFETTGNAEYKKERDKILNWVVKHTYDKSEIPIKRGKGDSTIATDTYSWSIAAIGPEKLESLGMNPDRILEFAEKNCSTEVAFKRPDGYTVRIKGFDFAPEANLARGGVISGEWTAQMVMAFKIMADYYYSKGLKAKAHSYEMKADDYMASLGKMVISSPSASGQGESCLPYATQSSVDTGHGWTTPKGDSTGSLAATAYTIFAYYKYNPLVLNE